MMTLPNRKHPRLKNYDYSTSGYYFITINTQDNKPIRSAVGRGLAPAESTQLTVIGQVCQQELLALQQRYDYVKIDRYVIMPTHLHAIVILTTTTAGASPRPTLTDIIGAYKSIVTRRCNQQDRKAGRKLFQTSFFEKVLRNQESYDVACEYMQNNPCKWILDNKNPPASC